MNRAAIDTSEFSPEMNLLLSCCLKSEDPRQDTDFLAQISGGVDWNIFLQLVQYHQVTPLVYDNLRRVTGSETNGANGVPPRVLHRLKARFNRQRLHTLALTAELLRIVTACRAEGIDVICLKGPVLAFQLYGDIAPRHIVDIDFLVREQDMEPIHAILTRNGFVPLHPELFSSKLHWKVFKNSKHHVPYFHREKGCQLELHLRLFKNIHVWPNSSLNAWVSPDTVVYAGVELKTLSAIDNVLFLFVHGAIHKWCLLKWAADIAQLSRSKQVDWEKLRDRALETGLERPVHQGLLLLERLFALPVPQAFARLPVDKTLLDMTHHALTVIDESRETAASGFFHALRKRFYLLGLKRERRYKLRYLRDLVYLDSHRGILRLPGYLYPLYILLNPFLWFYKSYIKRTAPGAAGRRTGQESRAKEC